MTKPWYERAKIKRIAAETGTVPVSGRAKKPVSRKKLPDMMVGAGQAEVQLGNGYNSLMGETRGFAVEDTPIRSETLSGQDVLYSIREVENREQLREHLGVSASASYSGIFSVSAKAEWSHDTTIDNHYFYLLISVRVKNGSTMLRKYELTKEAKDLLAKSPYNWKAFYARYGDMFVDSITSGGEFHALYEFQTHSREDKDKLKTSAKGSYGGFKASAEFQKNVEKIVSNTNVSVAFFIRGGKGKLPEPMDPKKIIEASLRFPQAVLPDTGAPVQYDAEYRDFLVADGFPSGEDVPFYGDIAGRNREVIARLARLNDQVGESQRTVSDPLYGSELKEEVARLKDQLGNKVRALAANPFTPHEFPAELETTYDAIKKQLIWRPMPGPMTGSLKRIAVGSHADIWGVNSEGKIYQWDEKKDGWEGKAGILQEISVGSDGLCIGVNRGGELYVWNAPRNTWGGFPRKCTYLGKGTVSFDAKFDSISVGHKEYVWGLTSDGTPCRYRNGTWCRVGFYRDKEVVFQEGFREVSAGSDGTVWIRDKSNHVFNYIFEQQKAVPLPGEMKHISVGDARHIWGINTDNHVVRWTGTEWHSVQGALADVSAAEDGTVWGITTKGNIVRLEE